MEVDDDGNLYEDWYTAEFQEGMDAPDLIDGSVELMKATGEAINAVIGGAGMVTSAFYESGPLGVEMEGDVVRASLNAVMDDAYEAQKKLRETVSPDHAFALHLSLLAEIGQGMMMQAMNDDRTPETLNRSLVAVYFVNMHLLQRYIEEFGIKPTKDGMDGDNG